MSLRLIAAGAMLFAAMAYTQEFRASLMGRISDPSGAAVPGATVVVTSADTGVQSRYTTSAEGDYQASFLPPGRYQVMVEHPGFRSVVKGPLELRILDRLRVDIALELGDLADRVTVTSEAPLLESATGNRGQVVDNRTLTTLPTQSRNPYTLMNLSAGVQYTGSLLYYRPFDNGAINSFSINGGKNGVNEYQLDGAPNNTNGNLDVAYVPPVEATQEFKIQTNSYDAQYGRTAGGVVNVTVKSGTNQLHGTAYEYLRRAPLYANEFVNNANRKPRSNQRVDQYGFELDGPVLLPKLYNGREKTFFMFSWERYLDAAPLFGSGTTLGTVPTPAQREGDFSSTFAAANRPYLVYDPLTVRPNPAFDSSRPVNLTNPQYIRSAFEGNRVPKSRFEPIALNILKDIPLPNQTGDPVTWVNNWLGTGVSENNDFYNLIARVDHNLTSAWRVYGRWAQNRRTILNIGGRYGWNTPAATDKTRNGRSNQAGVFDVVGTLSPSSMVNLRLSFNRNNQYNRIIEDFDIATLGFPSSLVGQLQFPNRYPVVNWENYTGTGNSQSATNNPSNTYSLQGSWSKIAGRHSLKTGGEFRYLTRAIRNVADGAGNYSFNRAWTSSVPQLNDPASGNAIASFLLGYMASASATYNVSPYYTWVYPVVFFQDDWQVSQRLTVNVGLRWDYEGPVVDRYDRANRGFDFNARSPIQVPGLDLKGGLLFAGVNGNPRGAFEPDRNNWQPRLGLAYKVLRSKPLVFRAGIGRYHLPTGEMGGTLGFSQTTTADVSTADFRPFQVFSNPFPNGLIAPPGSSLGLATQLGDAVAFNDLSRRIPAMWQFSAGFQYELRNRTLVEASYVGSRTGLLQVNNPLNVLRPEQLALGTAYLSQSVPNPFFGVLSPKTPRGAQAATQRRNLLLPYPQFTNVNMNNMSLGRMWYDSLQIKVEQRLKGGLTYLVSYTFSKTLEEAGYKEPQYAGLSRELTAFHVPHRLVASGVFEFPFGRQRRWLSTGVLGHVFGGWQTGWNAVFQSGPPMGLPGDFYLNGDPRLESGQSMTRWFNTSPALWTARPPDTLRTNPFRSPNIRRHSAPQLDITVLRQFRIWESHALQFRVSAFNATNTPLFNFPTTNPNSQLFGVVSDTQINMPRSVELGFRYSF